MLDLSSNSLHSLNENVFRGRDLYNLQKIFMRHCNIHVIIGRCFEGISNLVELDLSYNLLEVIPKAALKDCSYLMTLSLRGNPIRRVQKESFDNLKVFILCFIFISIDRFIILGSTNSGSLTMSNSNNRQNIFPTSQQSSLA